MPEILETNANETLENKKPGEASKEALDRELLAVSATEEKSEEVKEEREAYSDRGVTNVAVDKNLDNVSFSYKEKTVQYEAADGLDVVHVIDNDGTHYAFDFKNSLFRTNIGQPKKDADYAKNLFGRLDLCINTQNLIAKKLDKRGMKLIEDYEYIRGPKFGEDKVYFAAKKLLQPSDKGYEEGERKTGGDTYYLMVNLIDQTSSTIDKTKFKGIMKSAV